MSPFRARLGNLFTAAVFAAALFVPASAGAFNDETHKHGLELALAYMRSGYATPDELRAYDWLDKWGDENSSQCHDQSWGAINTGVPCALQILRAAVGAPDHWDDMYMCNGNRDVENRLGALSWIPYAGDYIGGTGAWLEVIPQWCSAFSVTSPGGNKFTQLLHFQDLKNSVPSGDSLAVPGYNNMRAFRRSGAFFDSTRLLVDRHNVDTSDCAQVMDCAADRGLAMGMKDDFAFRVGGRIPNGLPNDPDMQLFQVGADWGPEPNLHALSKYSTDPTRFLSTAFGGYRRGVEFNYNPAFSVPTPIWGLSAPVPYGLLPVVYATTPLAPYESTLIADPICNIPVVNTIFPLDGTTLPIELADFYDQTCMSRAYGVCVLCKKTRYVRDQESLTFSPMSALSTYWADKFRTDPGFLNGTPDLKKLAYALHGAGDVAVAHHVLSTMGNYHQSFEAEVESNLFRFQALGDVAKFRVLQGELLRAGAKNQSNVYPDGLPVITTGPVDYRSSIHDILNKTAHWTYSNAASVVDKNPARPCDLLGNCGPHAQYFLDDAHKSISMMAATVVLMLTKASNDYYSRDNDPATPESIDNTPSFPTAEVTFYGNEINGRMMMRHRDGTEGRRTWSFGQRDIFLSEKRNGFTGNWATTPRSARPAVANVGPRRTALVVNGTDDQVHMQTIRDRKFALPDGPPARGWKLLGRPPGSAALTFSPALASWDPFSRVVVVSLSDGALYYRLCAEDQNGCQDGNNGWGAWTALPAAPYVFAPEALAAISVVAGRVDVVVQSRGVRYHIFGDTLDAAADRFNHWSAWTTLADSADPGAGPFQTPNTVALVKNDRAGFDMVYANQFYQFTRQGGGNVSIQRYHVAQNSWGAGQVGVDIFRFGAPMRGSLSDTTKPSGLCAWVSAANPRNGAIEAYCGSDEGTYVLRYDQHSLYGRRDGVSAGQREWLLLEGPGTPFDFTTPLAAISWDAYTPTNDTYEHAVAVGPAGGSFQNHTLLLEDTVACDNSGGTCVLNNTSPDAFYKLTLDTASRVEIAVESENVMAAILQTPVTLIRNVGSPPATCTAGGAHTCSGQEWCERELGVTSRCVQVRWGGTIVESGCSESLSGCVSSSGVSGCHYADVYCAAFGTEHNLETGAPICDADGSWLTGNAGYHLRLDEILPAGTHYLWVTEWGFNLGCEDPTQSLTGSNHPFTVKVATTPTNDSFVNAIDISGMDGQTLEAWVRPAFGTSLDHFVFPQQTNHLPCPADTEQRPNNLFGNGQYVGNKDAIYTARFDTPTTVRFDLWDGSLPYTQLPRMAVLEDLAGYRSHPQTGSNCRSMEFGRIGVETGELFTMKPGVRYYFVFSPPLFYDIEHLSYMQDFTVRFFHNDSCGSADNLPLHTTRLVTIGENNNYSRRAFADDYGTPVNPPNLTPPACYPDPDPGSAPDKIFKLHLAARSSVHIRTKNADFPHLIFLADSNQQQYPTSRPRPQGSCTPTCFLADRVDSCVGVILNCSGGDATLSGREIHRILPPGDYAVVIDGINDASGTLELEVDTAPLVDDCGGPGSLRATTDGQWRLLSSNDVSLYNDSRQLSCGRSGAEHDAFYALELSRWAQAELETRAPLSINADGTRGPATIEGFDTTLGLLEGTSCDASLVELACNQDQDGKYSRIAEELEAGAYLTVVDGYRPASDGARPRFDLWGRFTLNDTIPFARSLRARDGTFTSRTYADSNAGFADDYFNIATCVNVPENQYPTLTHGSDAVYKLELTETTRLRAALSGLSYGVVYLIDGSKPLGPGAQVPGACSASTSDGTTWQPASMEMTLAPGTYYLVVDQSVATGGDYSLAVDFVRPDACQPIDAQNAPLEIKFDRASAATVRGHTGALSNNYAPPAGCASASKPTASANDAVYKFYIGTQGTRVQVVATPAAGSSIDPIVTLRRGSTTVAENPALCESGVVLGCNDDQTTGTLGSLVDVVVPSAGWYYVFVDSAAATSGAFDLTVIMAYPETCESAYTIGPGTYQIDTSNFPSQSPWISLFYGTSCALTQQGQDDSNRADATYKIAVPAGGRNVTLTLSTAIGAIQPILYVTRADSCPNLSNNFIASPSTGQLGCHLAPYLPNGGSTATLNLQLAEGEYLVFVDTRYNLPSARGPMTLTVDMMADTMASALRITGTGQQLSSGTSAANNDYSGSCGGGSARDIVYTFTLTSQQRVQINSAGTPWDTVLYLLNSAGVPVTGVNGEPGCSDDSGATRQSALDLTLGAGTYYLVVDGYDSASHGTASINAFWSPCPEIVTFRWLATSCFTGPQTITFRAGGAVAYSTSINGDCTCTPGIGRYTTRDPAVLALFRSGVQNLSVELSDAPNTALAWAMLSLGRQGDVVIFDQNNDGSAAARNADLCGAGYNFGLSPGGAFALSGTCKNSSDLSWRQALHSDNWVVQPGNFDGWHLPNYDSSTWEQPYDVGPVAGNSVWGTVNMPIGSSARWSWSSPIDWWSPMERVMARKTFLATMPSYNFVVTADDAYDVYLDGNYLGSGYDWGVSKSYRADVAVGAEATLAITIHNDGGPGGFVVDIAGDTSAPSTAQIWLDEGTLPHWNLLGTWQWGTPAASGSLSHSDPAAGGVHQHYFEDWSGFAYANANDVLITSVYLDPANPPNQIMLQWNNGTWDHRAYWGQNVISWGTNNTVSRRYMGPLPPLGRWVELRVPVAEVGLANSWLYGIAFSQNNGKAYWDRTGVIRK